MHETDQVTSRPTSRWSSSRLNTATESNSLSVPLIAARRRLLRPTRTSQQTFANMTKTKHDVEELFKLYYSTNSKLDQFKGAITGTRLPNSPQPTSPSPVYNPFLEPSSDVFRVRHCVSREDLSLFDKQYQEYQSVLDQLNKSPRHRPPPPPPTENDDGPMVIQSLKLHQPLPPDAPSNSRNFSGTRPDEPTLIKLTACSQDIATQSSDQRHTKRQATAPLAHRPKSSAPSTTIPTAVYTLASDRRDQLNVSPLSMSTSTGSQEARQPHVLTGTAVTAHQRPRTRSARRNPSAKPTAAKPVYVSSEPCPADTDISKHPAHIVTQSVASIPSKNSRYVLVTFPKARNRCHIPTSVERLLLPERFPVLFQNILHSSDAPQQHRK